MTGDKEGHGPKRAPLRSLPLAPEAPPPAHSLLRQRYLAAVNEGLSSEVQGGETGGNIGTEIARIEQTMRADRAAYDRDPAMQSRLRDLYEAQEAGGSLPAAKADEKAEIERIMGTDRRRYDRDEAMQARYLQLLEDEDRTEAPAPAAQDDNGGLAPMPRPSEWAAAGNNPAEYGQHAELVREVNDVLAPMDDATRASFNASFEGLSPQIHTAALSELADPRPVAVDLMTEAEVSELTSASASYRTLAQEWGHEAPRKLAVLRERLWRVIDRLDDAQARAAINWLDRLPTGAAVALYRKLAR